MKRAAVAVLAVALLSAGAAAATRHAQRTAAVGPIFHATVEGQSRRPVAGTPWRYTVRVLNEKNHIAAGTAIVRVMIYGRALDTVGWFGVRKGVLHRKYRWPQALRGLSAALQVEVRRRGGKRFVGYAVHVSPVTGSPRFGVRLTAESRSPTAGTPWRFVVRATHRSGARFSGTAVMRVLVRGRVVDTIGWFGLKGTLRKTYSFSPTLRGARVLVQADVRGPAGTRVVILPVRVR